MVQKRNLISIGEKPCQECVIYILFLGGGGGQQGFHLCVLVNFLL